MNKDRRGFIFARVGVRVAGHPRFLRIPAGMLRAAALGVWMSALTFSREEQLDGFCPFEAIQSVATEDVVQRLVDVGLFARDEQDGVHGVRILKYSEFNDTKEEIEEARRRDRERKRPGKPDGIQKHSGGRPKGSRRTPKGFRSESDGVHGTFPVSVSSSGSPSLSGSPGSDPPPPTVIQIGKGEPGSGVRRGGILELGERDPDIEARRAKSLEDAARLAADPTFAPEAKS